MEAKADPVFMADEVVGSNSGVGVGVGNDFGKC